MLRSLFGEPCREDGGQLQRANGAIAEYLEVLDQKSVVSAEGGTRQRRLHVCAASFVRALDELEQSKYCSDRFCLQITGAYFDDMDEAEREIYHKHVYFYKNALIRIFSVLDKLGFFLNELLQLETERNKSRYSYYTVLRRMLDRRVQHGLVESLHAIKQQYAPHMKALKHQRNLEIHLVNHEIADDLEHVEQGGHGKIPLEDLAANAANMDKGFEMVCESLYTVFVYVKRKRIC